MHVYASSILHLPELGIDKINTGRAIAVQGFNVGDVTLPPDYRHSDTRTVLGIHKEVIGKYKFVYIKNNLS